MFKLGDFFQPLNFLTLFYFICLFLFFDFTGTFIKHKLLKISDKGTRIVNWLLGFGFFIFLWFLLSLFITPGRDQILISITVVTIFTLPDYIKNGEYKHLIGEIWNLRTPLLVIAPFLPAVFVKASLPPYYSDEIAYHFISPFTLHTLAPIKYLGGFFSSLPRTLDLFWQLVFTLFHTYSVARLFHFMILVTAILFTYLILKKNFGFLSGFLFVLIFFALPQDIVFTSTLGFVDVGAFSVLLVGVVSAIDFFLTEDRGSLLLATAFWAMSLGIKYTGLTAFVPFLTTFLVTLCMLRKRLFRLFSAGFVIKLMVIFLLFGGFWYVRNFIWWGNPIYPFIFPCWGTHVLKCPITSSYFGNWTTKINISNLMPILNQLFPKAWFVLVAIAVSPILAFLTKGKEIKRIFILIFIPVILELIILKYFSGFTIRYQQHLQLYLILTIAIIFTQKYRKRFINVTTAGVLILLMVGSISLYVFTLRYTYTQSLNRNEVLYAIGQMTIYDWVDIHFPRMKFITRWCENPSDNKPTPLAVFEPPLIWENLQYDDEYYLRSFVTNCFVETPAFKNLTTTEVQYLKEKKMNVWIASISKCVPPDQIVPTYPYETESDLSMRKTNNKIICQSTEVGQHLFYFDYTKIK
jgi:hypothetical protein